MKRTRTISVLAALLAFFVVSATHSQQAPLKEVTLFSSGVAEFIHQGSLGPDGFVALPVPRDQMDDVVRSLTVLNAEGHPVTGITFPTGEELTAGLAFTFPEPVSVPRGGSSLVPIVNRRFQAEVIRSFDARRDEKHPRLALSFRNDSGRQLPDGIVTIYDGSRYAGDAFIPVLFEDGTARLSYAVDTVHTVHREGDTASEVLHSVTIVDGLLVEEHRLRRTTRYTLSAPGERAQPEPVQITHEIPAGWNIVSPQPISSSGQEYTFRTSGRTLVVTEERIREQRVALSAADRDQLVSYSGNRLIDPTVRRIIQNVIELRRQLETVREARIQAERDVAVITEDQGRIRENMMALERDSSLYRRYVRELELQENRLEILRSELSEAQQEETTAEAALREYLRTLQD